jgi:hypothetical protein
VRRYPWGLLWPLVFSIASSLLAVSYSVSHPQAPMPAYLAYLTIGCLGLFTCLAMASLHRRIAALERRIAQGE